MTPIMKKLLVTIFLAIFSTGALAEWIKVGSNSIGNFYVDKAGITKKRSMVKIWTMSDYLSPYESDFGTYLSKVALFECDCSNKMTKGLQTTTYSKNMMKGEVVTKDKSDENWEYIIPGTAREAIWEVACGKK